MKTMKDAWAQIQKEYGDEGLFLGNEQMVEDVEVIHTGSHLLDDVLGIGGLPRGRIIQFAGQESSGKTYMSLIAIAEYQKANPDGWAFFIDAEFTFDSEWAKSLGVDVDRIMVYRENSCVKIFERLLGQPSKTGAAKKTKVGLLDIEKENPSGLGLIVLDSVAAMIPPQEETSEVGKNNMALMARFLPPELRKLTPMLSATGVSFIGINQIRTDPGIMYGSSDSSPGGRALKHACSIMLNFSRIAAKESAIMSGEDRIGHHVRVRVDKNKLAPPFKVAQIALTYTGGIVEKNIEVRDLGVKYGIIERPSNVMYILDGEKYKGKEAIAEALENEDLANSVLQRVKEARKQGLVKNEVVENEETEDVN